MYALVTGAGGFLGRYIIERLLARGDRVSATSRIAASDLAALGVTVIPADLRDFNAVVAACRGIDCVFHVAGVSGIGVKSRYFHENNVLATRNVLEACRRNRVGRLVYTGSPSVVFDGRDQCGVDESAPYPTKWLGHYPRSKAIAERAVLAANGENGLLTCSLRPHLIWGPRDRALIPRLYDRARRKRLIRIGDGENLIDIVYVENAAAAHLQVADALTPRSPVAGNAYFISQGEPVNCWRWIDELLALGGLPPVEKSISLATAWRAGACFELLYKILRLASEPPMTRFLAAQFARSHYYDIGRARRDFGYHPAISTTEGMERLKAWLKEHPNY
ncbi:MAG: NAD-dependent epimerase/dehydratase family protein [Pirellulales bacterium]|nr:NAD-dependent epimerase/dehydratase family protein [Pirellulales bacterium]